MLQCISHTLSAKHTYLPECDLSRLIPTQSAYETLTHRHVHPHMYCTYVCTHTHFLDGGVPAKCCPVVCHTTGGSWLCHALHRLGRLAPPSLLYSKCSAESIPHYLDGLVGAPGRLRREEGVFVENKLHRVQLHFQSGALRAGHHLISEGERRGGEGERG